VPRKHTAAFKFEVVRQIEAGEKSLAALCREYELDPSLVIGWRHRVRELGSQAFPGSPPGDGAILPPGNPTTLGAAEARIAELERLVGQLTLENQFLKKALQRASSRERKGSP
jgi:transposase